MGEATAVVKYFCNEVNTRHLVVPQAAGLWYYNVEFNCICGYATEVCPEMSIFPLSIPEDFTEEDMENAANAIKNSEFKHVFSTLVVMTLFNRC